VAPSHRFHEPPDRHFDIVWQPDAFVAVGANDDKRAWPLASTTTIERSVTARAGRARPRRADVADGYDLGCKTHVKVSAMEAASN
jgi:hypothetical protein